MVWVSRDLDRRSVIYSNPNNDSLMFQKKNAREENVLETKVNQREHLFCEHFPTKLSI